MIGTFLDSIINISIPVSLMKRYAKEFTKGIGESNVPPLCVVSLCKMRMRGFKPVKAYAKLKIE